MLASLLPGLRDVRTPLVVGYLWLVIGWLIWANDLPRRKPPGDGLIARIFELSQLLGLTATLAAVSFLAYVLGALLTVPSDNRYFVRAVDRFSLGSVDLRETAALYNEFLVVGVQGLLDAAPESERGSLSAEEMVAQYRFQMNVPDLRARLLAANQELYGEYDRLAAEAGFRINLFLPLVALGIVVGVEISWWWTFILLFGAFILLIQGINRLRLSTTVLRRAIIAGVIEHPLHARIRQGLEQVQSSRSRQRPQSN
jgi:hypothetical protein